MIFHLFRDAAGEWRWHLKATNGRIIADSGEGYKRRAGALHAISLIQANAQFCVVKEAKPCKPPNTRK